MEGIWFPDFESHQTNFHKSIKGFDWLKFEGEESSLRSEYCPFSYIKNNNVNRIKTDSQPSDIIGTFYTLFSNFFLWCLWMAFSTLQYLHHEDVPGEIITRKLYGGAFETYFFCSNSQEIFNPFREKLSQLLIKLDRSFLMTYNLLYLDKYHNSGISCCLLQYFFPGFINWSSKYFLFTWNTGSQSLEKFTKNCVVLSDISCMELSQDNLE